MELPTNDFLICDAEEARLLLTTKYEDLTVHERIRAIHIARAKGRAIARTVDFEGGGLFGRGVGQVEADFVNLLLANAERSGLITEDEWMPVWAPAGTWDESIYLRDPRVQAFLSSYAETIAEFQSLVYETRCSLGYQNKLSGESWWDEKKPPLKLMSI